MTCPDDPRADMGDLERLSRELSEALTENQKLRQQRDFARDRMEFFRGQWQGARRRFGQAIAYHQRWAVEHGADPGEVQEGLSDAGLIIGDLTTIPTPEPDRTCAQCGSGYIGRHVCAPTPEPDHE